jgi:hypothetical protein
MKLSRSLGIVVALMSAARVDAAPEVLASDLYNPTVIIVGGRSLYFVIAASNGTDGKIVSMPKGGGALTTIAAQQPRPRSLVQDADNVYWDTYGTFSQSPAYYQYDGTIVTAAKAGGAPRTLATGQSFPRGLAVDGTGVYWAVGGTPDWLKESDDRIGRVMRLAPDSSQPEVIDRAPIYYEPLRVLLGPTAIYWTNSALHTLPRTGGPSTVTAGGGWLQSVSDGQSVYWLDDHGALWAMPLAGGTIRQLAQSPGYYPSGLVYDADGQGGGLYWAWGEEYFKDGVIMKVALATGQVSTIAGGEAQPQSVAVDDQYVYWTTSGGYATPASVRRIPK